MEVSSDESNNTYVPHLYSRLLKLEQIYRKLDPNGSPLIKLKQQLTNQLKLYLKQELTLHFGKQKEMPKLITSHLQGNEIKFQSNEADQIHIQQKIGSFSEQIKQTQRQFNLKLDDLTHHLSELGNKLQISQNKISSLFDILHQHREPSHQPNPVVNDIIQSAINISDKSAYLTTFKFTDSVIQYIGKDRTATQLLSSTIIKFNTATTFQLKVLMTQSSCIKFGIIDKKYMGERSCWNYPNTVYYHGWGHVMTGGEQEQYPFGGFKSGDWIRMRVDLKEGKIVWGVKKDCLKLKEWKWEEYSIEKRSKMLQNAEIDWIPFIALYNKGDRVEWSRRQ